MKNFLKINLPIVFTVILIFVLSNCKKKPDDKTDNDPAAPTAYTDTALFVSQTWATLNAIITPGNLLTTISFEYDTDSNQVVFQHTIFANPDTLSGNSSLRQYADLLGLTPNTTYYYRAKAVNILGESYGRMYWFTTLSEESSNIIFHPGLTYGEISDIEDNVYKTIQIGSQTWTAQNLAVTKYNDGEPITLAVNYPKWSELLAGAYSWYNNVEIKYGALYNWYAVNSGKLCPDGWRVPADEDWKILTDYLGGTTVAGDKLKEATYMHWATPNTGASNYSGFTALPGGYRYYSGNYNNITRYGYWWTSTETASNSGIGRSLYYDYSNIDEIKALDKRTGASVRCIKN